MQAGFACHCWMRDSMTLSPQNAHGIESRIFAGSGSGMDVCVIESKLSLSNRQRKNF
jgi:hypothetical protein